MKTTDKDERELYADEVILNIRNQLEEYGQVSPHPMGVPVHILELEVLSMLPKEVRV